jgi:citrate lyase beta subunit
VTRPNRLRRSCLSVPGSSERLLSKAPTIEVDRAFVDLEDSVPAALKNDETRARVVPALVERPWRAPTLAVRVNPVESE